MPSPLRVGASVSTRTLVWLAIQSDGTDRSSSPLPSVTDWVTVNMSNPSSTGSDAVTLTMPPSSLVTLPTSTGSPSSSVPWYRVTVAPASTPDTLKVGWRLFAYAHWWSRS